MIFVIHTNFSRSNDTKTLLGIFNGYYVVRIIYKIKIHNENGIVLKEKKLSKEIDIVLINQNK